MGPSEGKVALFLSVFESILKSHEVDLLEQDYTQRGEAFFHVPPFGSGGGTTAALGALSLYAGGGGAERCGRL